jgi:hypothetical protein
MKHHIRSSHVVKISHKKITVRKTKGRPAFSYVRKATTRRVASVPAYDVGAIGRSTKVIGPLKGGMLTRYGYHPVEAMTNRHKALTKGISKGEKPLSVMRRLVAIGTLTKRTLPRASRIYRQDAKWISRKYLKVK